jgi:ribosomal protein L13E
VKEHKRTEEQQKDLIFDIYSKWREEPSNDRLFNYYRDLCKQIYLWCKSYYRKIHNMGEEIAVVTIRIMKNKENIPTDKKSFFNYLSKALKNEKPNFLRKYNTEDIKIPKEIKSKIKNAEDVLRMKERNLGRALTKEEQIQTISDWYGISKKRAILIIKAIEIRRMDFANNKIDKNGKRIDILDLATSSIYMDNNFFNPLDEYLIKNDRKYILEAVEYLLSKKQQRARGCYRALFTLHCIENYKDFEGLYTVLDKEVLEDLQKDGKEPNQYEIYMKYHPKAKQKSAEAESSKNLNEFLEDIKAYLKSKNY